jgi:hypothetical protein
MNRCGTEIPFTTDLCSQEKLSEKQQRHKFYVVHPVWATSTEETGQSFVLYYNGAKPQGIPLLQYNTMTFLLYHTMRR